MQLSARIWSLGGFGDRYVVSRFDVGHCEGKYGPVVVRVLGEYFASWGYVIVLDSIFSGAGVLG